MNENESPAESQPVKSIRPEYESPETRELETVTQLPGSTTSGRSPGSSVLWLLGLLLVCVAGYLSSAGWLRLPQASLLPEQAPSDSLSQALESQLNEASSQPQVEKSIYTSMPPLVPYLPQESQQVLDECLRVAEHLVSGTGPQLDALEMQARCEFQLGSTEKAKAIWTKILERDGTYAYALRGLGDLATLEGKLTEAIGFYRRAVLAQPQDLSRQSTLATALIDSGEFQEAEQVLQGIVAENPAFPVAYLRLGQIRQQQQRWSEAREAYEQALKLEPNSAKVHQGLAMTLARLGETEKAKEHQQLLATLRDTSETTSTYRPKEYVDLQALFIDVAKLYTDIARVYISAGENVKGQFLLIRACRMDPKNLDARQALAWLANSQQRPFEAIRWMRECSEIAPDELAFVAEAARLYADADRLQEAEKILTDFVERNPATTQAQGLLSRFYVTADPKPELALKYAQQVVEKEDSIPSYVWLATVQEQAGDLPATIAALEKAVQLGAGSAALTQKLALLKEQLAKTNSPPTPE